MISITKSNYLQYEIAFKIFKVTLPIKTHAKSKIFILINSSQVKTWKMKLLVFIILILGALLGIAHGVSTPPLMTLCVRKCRETGKTKTECEENDCKAS